MVKYGKTDSLSMGNDAIAGDATLYVDADGNKTLTIPFQQIPVGGILGTIIHYWYFPDDTVYYSSDWADNLDYESEYTYNASGMIDSVTFPVYTDEELIPTALESDFSLMGKQRTYIKPDYSEVIYAVTGEVTDNTEVDMPTITAVQSADGSSYEVTLAMESASDYADADIYYLITNDDDTELTEENRIAYTGMLTVDKSAANSDGVVNILAQAVSGENSSMINLKKILFDMTEANPTPTVEPTTEPTEEPTATPTVEPTAEPTEEPTATPESTEEPTEEPSSDIDVTEDGYYNVKVQLYKSDVDELSMGNAAFEDAPMAVIKTENGKSTIIVSTIPVEMDYYEDGSALITSALKNMRFTNANGQLQYVTPVLQTATTSVNGDSVVEFDYLEKFSFALPSTTEDYVDVQILVPNTPMGEDYIDARLFIDWSTLASYDSTVTITSAEKSESGITAELSSGGAAETVTAIAVLYDADGALIKMVSQEVALSETGTTAVEFAADATAAAKTKIFVWDSTAGLVPYAVSYDI